MNERRQVLEDLVDLFEVTVLMLQTTTLLQHTQDAVLAENRRAQRFHFKEKNDDSMTTARSRTLLCKLTLSFCIAGGKREACQGGSQGQKVTHSVISPDSTGSALISSSHHTIEDSNRELRAGTRQRLER